MEFAKWWHIFFETLASLRRSFFNLVLAEWECLLCDWRMRFLCRILLRFDRYLLSEYAVPSDRVAIRFIPKSTPRQESSCGVVGISKNGTQAQNTPVLSLYVNFGSHILYISANSLNFGYVTNLTIDRWFPSPLLNLKDSLVRLENKRLSNWIEGCFIWIGLSILCPLDFIDL